MEKLKALLKGTVLGNYYLLGRALGEYTLAIFLTQRDNFLSRKLVPCLIYCIVKNMILTSYFLGGNASP